MPNWFITGVSSGLGRALAEAALTRGDTVSGTVRNDGAANAFAALAPGRARPVMLDITDRPATARAVAEAETAMGGIDILVANAGYSMEGNVEASSFDDIEGQIATHVLAPIALIKAALPGMRARRSGHIMTVGSLAAHTVNAGISIYGGVKAAIETMSIALAQEVAPLGIRVTAVVPGAFRTRLGDSRRSAKAGIADYAEADELRRSRLGAFSGQQRGDPAKAARALIAITDASEPPVLFALGPDAIAGFRIHAEALIETARVWEEIGSTTDLDPAGG